MAVHEKPLFSSRTTELEICMHARLGNSKEKQFLHLWGRGPHLHFASAFHIPCIIRDQVITNVLGALPHTSPSEPV
jgi:hypothetical protein